MDKGRLEGLEGLPPEVLHFALLPHIIEITKSNRRSVVHRNVPMDPKIDFPELIRQSKAKGVFDPTSIEVWNKSTGKRIPHALPDDFFYSDKGRVEFVVENPKHRRFEIRFKTAKNRPPLRQARHIPAIGIGDLLRYNAQQTRPIMAFFSAGMHDLTGDGRADLVSTWNYAYRPGVPWDGVICYPRVGKGKTEFGELRRLRYRTAKDKTLRHFVSIYMSADCSDLNGDGYVDLVVTYRNGLVHLLLNTRQRDHGGMPIFEP